MCDRDVYGVELGLLLEIEMQTNTNIQVKIPFWPLLLKKLDAVRSETLMKSNRSLAMSLPSKHA